MRPAFTAEAEITRRVSTNPQTQHAGRTTAVRSPVGSYGREGRGGGAGQPVPVPVPVPPPESPPRSPIQPVTVPNQLLSCSQ